MSSELHIPKLAEDEEALVTVKPDGSMSVIVMKNSKASISIGVMSERRVLGEAMVLPRKRAHCRAEDIVSKIAELPSGKWQLVAERAL